MYKSKKLDKKLTLVLLALKSLEPQSIYSSSEFIKMPNTLDLQIKRSSMTNLGVKIKKLKANLSRYFLDLIYMRDETKTIENVLLKNYIVNFELLLRSCDKELIESFGHKKDIKLLNSKVQIKNVLPLIALNCLEDYFSI